MIDPGLLKVAIEVVSGFVRRRGKEPAPLAVPKIDRHLREALRWSQRIQFYGMSKAEETDAATIPLRMNVEPRRFRSPSVGEYRSEIDLLGDDRNYFLLGDPGAGKTTTLKRLVQRLLLDRPSVPTDIYQFPIVLRLRELRSQETLFEAIAHAVGIPIERRHELDDPDAPVELYVGDLLLRDAIIEFLNDSHVALLLDGLDEVSPSEQFRLRRELSWLVTASRRLQFATRYSARHWRQPPRRFAFGTWALAVQLTPRTLGGRVMSVVTSTVPPHHPVESAGGVASTAESVQHEKR